MDERRPKLDIRRCPLGFDMILALRLRFMKKVPDPRR